MRIHVMLLGVVAGAVVALTPTHAFAQEMQERMQRHGQMQDMQDMTERERLEQMQEHMVEGMRRMAVRMDAVQKRIAAIDRGEPDAAPLPEGMGQGMGQGQGMRARDGTAPGCPNMQPPDEAAAAEQGGDT